MEEQNKQPIEVIGEPQQIVCGLCNLRRHQLLTLTHFKDRVRLQTACLTCGATFDFEILGEVDLKTTPELTPVSKKELSYLQ